MRGGYCAWLTFQMGLRPLMSAGMPSASAGGEPSPVTSPVAAPAPSSFHTPAAHPDGEAKDKDRPSQLLIPVGDPSPSEEHPAVDDYDELNFIPMT